MTSYLLCLRRKLINKSPGDQWDHSNFGESQVSTHVHCSKDHAEQNEEELFVTVWHHLLPVLTIICSSVRTLDMLQN